MGQESWVSALWSVSCAEARGRGEGGFTRSPSICCYNKVDVPSFDKQRSQWDVLEVQPTINKFQPTCVCIDVRVVLDAAKRLGTVALNSSSASGGDRKLTLGQFATSSALVSMELRNIEMR